MKILHVIPGLTVEAGGPTTVLQALVRHQAEAGHPVTVLTTDQGVRSGKQPAALHAAAEVERIPVRGPERFAYSPSFTGVVRSRLRESDVVHVHSIFTYPVHVALREALAVGTPVVLRPCGILHRYSLRRSAWRKKAYLAACGRMVRLACAEWHYTSENESAQSWPWDESPRFVLPNGIVPEDFALDRSEARQMVENNWPRLGRSPYVLFLGRLHPKKRPDLLLEAFLAGAPPAFKLVLAGPDECGLWGGLASRFLRGSSSAERVVRIPTVAGRAKVALMAGASLFALPSEHENFGNAPLEALATGTPLLLSPHVDLAGPVVAADLGHSAPLDTVVWQECFARLVRDAEVARGFVRRAREWVARHYSWAEINARLLEHYRRLAANRVLKSSPVLARIG